MGRITLGSDLFARNGQPWDAPKLPLHPTSLRVEVVGEAVNPFSRYAKAEGYKRERVKPRYRPDPRKASFEKPIDLRMVERNCMAGHREAAREEERRRLGGTYRPVKAAPPHPVDEKEGWEAARAAWLAENG